MGLGLRLVGRKEGTGEYVGDAVREHCGEQDDDHARTETQKHRMIFTTGFTYLGILGLRVGCLRKGTFEVEENQNNPESWECDQGSGEGPAINGGRLLIYPFVVPEARRIRFYWNMEIKLKKEKA